MTLNAQNRNTLWLNGNGATSASWDRAIDAAEDEGYDFNAINTFFYAPHINGVAGSADLMNAQLSNENRTDVLGIGHDGGGIVLRQMAKSPGTRLSALILDGVPNQGSQTLKRMLPVGTNNQMNDLVAQVLAFKSNANQCNACRIVEAFQDWVNDINANEQKYREYQPDHPTIINLGAPSIPHAVIWGNEDEGDALVLTRLLGSRAQAVLWGDDTGYLECYRDEIEDRRQKINDAFLDGLAQSVIGAASSVGKFLKPTGPNIAEGVAKALEAIYKRIQAARIRDREMAELLECEMVHQGLNGYWNLIASGGYTAVTTTITEEYNCCETCYDEPDSQVQGYCFSWCSQQQWPCVNTYTITYYEYEPHDGLLNKSEQLLAGAAKTYETKKTNHFQEQYWSQQPIKDAFVDLFNGGAGAAFQVPK
jgi:pimeloyl-ACP methyl ester carboxylesterase